MTTPETIETESSAQAEASSAHSRINVPLNLNAWRERPREEQDLLLWFHQHLLDEGLNWDQAVNAIGYDRSVVFRLLKGTYQADNWTKPIAAIRSYRRIALKRATIRQAEFAETAASRLIWAGLDYAITNQSITTIIGESRMGKTVSTLAWCQANNHGRSVYVVAPPVGGIKSLMQAISGRVGANKNQSIVQMLDALHRAFNGNRILVIDEAHRLMPNDARTINPANLELLRDLHDQTGCALALVATARFSERLSSGKYQFEQLIGRIGMPIRLPKNAGKSDVMPIVTQYIKDPTPALLGELLEIANKPGRLGILTETLKVASRIAGKSRETLAETHVLRAIDIRRKMSGEAA